MTAMKQNFSQSLRHRSGRIPCWIAATRDVLLALLIAAVSMVPALAQQTTSSHSSTGPASSQRERAMLAMQAALSRQQAAVEKQMAAHRPAESLPPAMMVAATQAGPSTADTFVPVWAGPVERIEPSEVRWSGPVLTVPAVEPLEVAAATNCDPLSGNALTQLIASAASAFTLDPALVREVARQESAFHPCSVSAKGAEGLMQLMPATQAMLEVEDPFDPQESLFAGAKLLSSLLQRYNGNLALALSAYNAGPTRVDRVGRVPAIPETQNYVATILSRLSSYPD